MKKFIVLLLAALMIVGLGVSCKPDPEPDAFKGTWKGTDATDYEFTFVCDGFGALTYTLKHGDDTKTYEEIASLINRSEMAVAITLRSNGCSYRMPKYWKGNELKFLKDNQDLWDASNVELYMLGEEKEWLKEKRKKDAKDKPV